VCGRYTLAPEEGALIEAFDVPTLGFDFAPRFNLAPGQNLPVVAADHAGRRMGLMTWGLVPGWKESRGTPSINARAESVASKPSFRDAFQRRRCLVPADGFYEWARRDGGKVPYWLHPAAGGLIAFAGIWERWSAAESSPYFGFAILTTEASPDLAGIHHRMPVVVPSDRYGEWLDTRTAPDQLTSLMRPAPGGTFVSHQVSPRVNRPSEDDAGLVEPAA